VVVVCWVVVVAFAVVVVEGFVVVVFDPSVVVGGFAVVVVCVFPVDVGLGEGVFTSDVCGGVADGRDGLGAGFVADVVVSVKEHVFVCSEVAA